ncbi:hypothetical protein D9611_010938 [Ephemerocybe angulata]|uniref:F-box domain-containing protein n=1 Tax=Ephemerocybe angulata TaxID=980116 RepID=A0A8H5C4Z4_9AGAR|nr:hypothetical protein D9611_010938 [Tulosesus angulatus]
MLPGPPSLIDSKCFPWELLEEIFFIAVNLIYCNAILQSLNLVSRKWRGIFLSSPRLWGNLAFIRFDHIGDKKERLSHILKRLSCQLQRAGNSPLSFDFNAWSHMESDIDDVDDFSRKILALLCKYSRQWKVVKLFLNTRGIPNLAPIRNNLPLLQRLAIGFYGPGPTAPDSAVDYFVNAPSLSHLSSQEPSLKDLFLFPWAQLAAYRNPNADTHFAFANSPNLKSLECLVLPKLSYLAISMDEPTVSLFESLDAFLATSKCPLHTLILKTCREVWSKVDGCLAALLLRTPELRVLKLGGQIPHIDLACLARTEGDEYELPFPLVPHLQDLRFKNLPHWREESDADGYAGAINAVATRREEMHRVGLAHQRLDVQVSAIANVPWREDEFRRRLEGHPGVDAPEMKQVMRWTHVLSFEYWGRDLDSEYYKAFRALIAVLREMESYDIEGSDLRLLHSSEILVQLKEFADPGEWPFVSRTLEPLDWLLKINARFTALYDKWEVILIRDARTKRSWMDIVAKLRYVHQDSGQYQGLHNRL